MPLPLDLASVAWLEQYRRGRAVWRFAPSVTAWVDAGGHRYYAASKTYETWAGVF
jgi:hypothetical protein